MDLMDEDDFSSPMEKRARFDPDIGQTSGDDEGSGRGRTGRMRKKSAKVLEMEEFEETERKVATLSKTQGSAKKKKPVKAGAQQGTQLLHSPEAPSNLPLSVLKEDSNDEISVTDSPFKMKLPFTPTGMAAGPPLNLPPPPPSSKNLTKKTPAKTKKQAAPMSPPNSGLEAMLKGSPIKEKNLFDSFSIGSSSGGEEVSALQMALQAELSPVPPSSSELVAKMAERPVVKQGLGSPTHAPHLAAALLQGPISSSSLMLSSSVGDTSASSHMEESDDLDSDGQLVIDTHSEARKKKKRKEKKSPKVKVEQIMHSPGDDSLDRGPILLNLAELLVKGCESGLSSGDEDLGEEEDAPVYSNTDQMALKLMTSAEKKASKKKGKKQKKDDPDKPKKKRSPTAYMLWCNSYRGKVVAENPGIDFAQISKRLGEIWQSLPEKEKMMWKRKAKKAAGKGSTLISTGKGGTKAAPAAAAKPAAASKPATAGGKSPAESKPAPSKPPSKTVSIDDLLANTKQSGTSAVDVAAHLKLLGESLSIIGARLQEHQGQIAVQGSLSVLLDSLLCALGPLMCLTQLVKEFNGTTPETHAKTLDNLAYFMPGIG